MAKREYCIMRYATIDSIGKLIHEGLTRDEAITLQIELANKRNVETCTFERYAIEFSHDTWDRSR